MAEVQDTTLLTAAVQDMLTELKENRLEVVKVGVTRQAQSRNAEWYQKFCQSYTSTRKRYPRLRTFIKRQNTIKALNRMLNGDTKSLYAVRLLPFVEQYIYDMTERYGS